MNLPKSCVAANVLRAPGAQSMDLFTVVSGDLDELDVAGAGAVPFINSEMLTQADDSLD